MLKFSEPPAQVLDILLTVLSDQRQLSNGEVYTALRELWWPLALRVANLGGLKPLPWIVGIAGPPGAGKTTTAEALAIIFKETTGAITARLSLEDTYYSVEERKCRQLKWRAVPGSHDLTRLSTCLEDVLLRKETIGIPRYDMQRDHPLSDEIVACPQILFLEGWLIGSNLHSYRKVSDLLSILVYLDVPESVAKHSRFAREQRACEAGAGGYDPETMEKFWVEVLQPGNEIWVRPIRGTAHILVSVDENRRAIVQ